MRILFTAFPAASHFFPLVPFAWALRSAGHEVAVAAPPGFLPVVRGSGLTGVEAGADVDLGAVWNEDLGDGQAWRHSEEARAARGMRMFAVVAEAMAGDVTDFARRWGADLVVYEPRAYAGLVAAEQLGLPLVRHLWGTDYTVGRWDIESPALMPLLERHGATGTDPLGALTLDVCPPSMQPATAPNRRLMRYVPFNGPGVIPDLATEPHERPRVCVTWGTTFVKQAGHLDPVRHSVAALRELDVEIVVAVGSGHRHLLGDLPPGTRVLESVPLNGVLPVCDAIVHQGGAGTMITAAVLGLPQLVVPSFADEPVNAQAAVDSGAGRSLPLTDATVERLREEAGALLGDNPHRRAALRIRDEVAELPSPADLVGPVTGLVPDAPARTPGTGEEVVSPRRRAGTPAL